ncbi:unnamed protein product [Mytilus edulis]|uniref:Uncharacterized protein n=1 Tax=Mytilus edulis TaxID=6550 RepID=A0A8S3QN06_MYTED|nr:unnamed protein product [Mytilus edulis]
MLSPLNRSSLAALSPEMDRQLTLSPAVDMSPLDRNFRTESSFRPPNRSLTGEMTRSSLSQSPSTIRSGSSRSSTAPSPLLTPSPGMVNLLSTLGGHKVGDTVRKMLRVLGTNGLWSNYSLKGKKKKNFSELSLCRVVTKSCIKIHRCSVSEVEECIAETLKHAPAQKDGPRYKKRPETNTNQPADQRAEINNLE